MRRYLFALSIVILLSACANWRFTPYDYTGGKDAHLDKKTGGYSVRLRERHPYIQKKISLPVTRQRAVMPDSENCE